LLREFWNSTLGLPYHANELDLSEDDIQNAIGNHDCTFAAYPSTDGQWRFHTDGCDQGGPLNYVAVEWRLKPDFSPDHQSETDIHNYIGRVVGVLEVPPDANMTKWEQGFGHSGRYNLWYNFQSECSVVDLNPDQDSARRLAIGRNGPQRGKWRGAPLYLCRFDSAMAGKAIVESTSEFGDHGIAVDRAYAVGLTVSLIKNRNLILPFDMPESFRRSLRKVHGEIAARNGVKRIEYNKRQGDDFALALTYAVLAAMQFIRRG
jgi:hypothetical protein